LVSTHCHRQGCKGLRGSKNTLAYSTGASVKEGEKMFRNVVTKQTEQPMPTQQQTSTVLPTPVASAQPEAAPVVSSSAPSPATQNTTPTTTSAVTTSHSINSGPKSSARGHDEGFHGYSGYHQNSKSSMESLHSRDGRLVH
jgi:hypothetical protein